MRDVVCIYTGQGAVGDFRTIAVFTGQFTSCSPVLMFNEKTCMGGLYHLPGKGGDATKLKNDEWNNLSVMLDLVAPTVIWLYPAGCYCLRQAFIEYKSTVTLSAPAKITEDDIVAAKDDLELARAMAFDRVYKGDQQVLGDMFAKAKACVVLGYDVKLSPISHFGIQVSADDNGKLDVGPIMSPISLGGTVYDMAKKRPPKELCAVLNPDIDYSIWMSATIAEIKPKSEL